MSEGGVRGARPPRAGGVAWLLASSAVLFAAACTLEGGPAAPLSVHCPDLTVEALDHYDVSSGMRVQPPLSGKLKAALGAALVLDRLAAEVDANLTRACAAFLADLGSKAKPARPGEACGLLVSALVDARARLGAGATLLVDAPAPTCGAPVDALTQCAAACEPAIAASGAKATCEAGTLSGGCDAVCAGVCSGGPATACRGACDGACDGKVKGTCAGLCVGKCDGKTTAGGAAGGSGGGSSGGANANGKGGPVALGSVCAGVCDGTCDGTVMATCVGVCSGVCTLAAPAKCAGTCTGSCSSDLKAPVCTGDLHVSHLGDECRARCDADLAAALACVEGPTLVRVLGASEPGAARAFAAAVEKDLPSIARLAGGLGARVPSLVAEVSEVSAAVATAVKGSYADPVTARQAAACIDRPFADVASAAASLQANLDLARAVLAAAASGGAGVSAVPVDPRK